jgi:hypothetical protein
MRSRYLPGQWTTLIFVIATPFGRRGLADDVAKIHLGCRAPREHVGNGVVLVPTISTSVVRATVGPTNSDTATRLAALVC